MDFVAGWFIKAAYYIQNTQIKVGLVSTNSITQGEQAIKLWKHLILKLEMEIYFAHQTFKWSNEAKGRAAVYCVIIGFSHIKKLSKKLFLYPDVKSDPTSKNVAVINQYLVDAPILFIEKRSKPLDNIPAMIYGTKPTDGGNLLFTEDEMKEFILKEPLSEKYFRPWVGAKEFINGYTRYCLYLKNCPPNELRKMPYVLERVEAVREMRSQSTDASTLKWASTPTLFQTDRTINSDILIIPRVTSENRKYTPIGFHNYPAICSDAVFQLPNANNYLFGILTSSMHMAWMKTVCGRLKGDFRYPNTLVYNNFVFPDSTEKKKNDISAKAQKILDIRYIYQHSGSSLADLYDPLAMPVDLLKAHLDLDKAVEKAYGQTFKTDEERVAFLFRKYQEKSGIKIDTLIHN